MWHNISSLITTSFSKYLFTQLDHWYFWTKCFITFLTTFITPDFSIARKIFHKKSKHVKKGTTGHCNLSRAIDLSSLEHFPKLPTWTFEKCLRKIQFSIGNFSRIHEAVTEFRLSSAGKKGLFDYDKMSNTIRAFAAERWLIRTSENNCEKRIVAQPFFGTIFSSRIR